MQENLLYQIEIILLQIPIGPYAALFGKLLSDIYTYALHDIHEKDCQKLDFLLNTWEERKLLPNELILRMKSYLGNRAVPVI